MFWGVELNREGLMYYVDSIWILMMRISVIMCIIGLVLTLLGKNKEDFKMSNASKLRYNWFKSK